MVTGTTQPRGTGRGGQPDGQTGSSVGEVKATRKRESVWKARVITTIAAIPSSLSTRAGRFGDIAAVHAATAAVLAALIVVLAPAPAHAQNKPTLDLVRIASLTSVSNEDGSPTIEYAIRSEGTVNQNRLFCGNGYASEQVVAGADCPANQSSQPENTVPIEIDVEWEDFDKYNRAGSALPVHTKGAVVSQTALDSIKKKVGDTWFWVRTETGISRHDDRPLQATLHLRKVGTKYDLGTKTSLEFAVNPQIVVYSGATATEGTDANMTFVLEMIPPALEAFGVNYATSDGTATAGSDYTATSGRLVFGKTESTKTIEVPIIDDMVDDSGETFSLTLSNPNGGAQLILDEFAENGFVATATTHGTILNDEPGPNPSVDDLPLVTIEADSAYVTEGSDAVFKLTRTGETTDALTVALTAAETGAMLAGAGATTTTFAEGDAETELKVATAGDNTVEDDSTLTVMLTSGTTYRLGTNDQTEAAISVLDDDATSLPGGTVAVEGTTVWTADMTVTDYGNGSIGAGTADLLANQRGSAGLQARSLYYHTEERKLRMAFTSAVESGALTLAAGNVKLTFPDDTSGDSSFTWNNVDVDWTDGQTFEARLVSGEQEATEAPDPTLEALTVSDATLSPAFDAQTLTYTATVGADTATVTVAGTPTDDDAAVAYTPSTDADSGQTGHQVAVAVGDTVATVTVTAADGQHDSRVPGGRQAPGRSRHRRYDRDHSHGERGRRQRDGGR